MKAPTNKGRGPLKEHLNVPISEERINGVWQRTKGNVPVRVQARRLPLRPIAIAAAAATLLGLGTWFAINLNGDGLNDQEQASTARLSPSLSVAAHPVVRAAHPERSDLSNEPIAPRNQPAPPIDFAVPHEFVATDAGDLFVLPDGSRLVAEVPGTRVTVLAEANEGWRLQLTHGRILAEVHERRWVVLCDASTVEARVATFTVDLEISEVAVREGSIALRAAAHPTRTVTVRAHEAATLGAGLLSGRARTSAVTSAVEAAPPASGAWREEARRGDFDSAYSSWMNEGGSAQSAEATPDELMLMADVARLSGHPREARVPLEQLVRNHRDAAIAPLAAITLARVAADQLHDAQLANWALVEAQALGVPTTFREEVLGRFALARRQLHASDADEARRVYLEQHPDGRFADALNEAP